jgi:DNA-binding beta-propeller fold protein YncE
MGGNGIAVIDVATNKYIGTITGSYLNLRHMVINNGNLFLSSNKYGFIQKVKLDDILSQDFDEQNKIVYTKWETVNVGQGARTIDITVDGKYIFACVNNASKVAVVDALTMETIAEVDAAKFPVGMALSPNGRQLITTSQGKDSVPASGNTIMVFEIIYDK